MERKNINRGFRKLQVWNDSIELFELVCKVLDKNPFEYKKTVANAIDASNSIARNIAEGYCRKSIKEYMRFLYYSLGSIGELYTVLYSLLKIKMISNENFDNLDQLMYKVENKILKLISSLQKKLKENTWYDTIPQ